MVVSRRRFLAMSLGAPLVAAGARAALHDSQQTPLAAEPIVTNYNSGGDYLLVEGKTLLVGLSFAAKLRRLTGSLPVLIAPESASGAQLQENQPLFFYQAGDRNFRTILTAPLDVVEGSYLARLSGFRGGTTEPREISYQVRRGAYRRASLWVDPNFTDPTPEIAARMKHDFETMLPIYQRRTPRRWNQPFVRPVPGRDRHNFGDRRTYNGAKHARHSGLDYRARMATPVSAMNDGVVVFSGEQWVPGQTICIDHGGGVFSKYMHLSERMVSESTVVKRGEIIARSGRSGGQKPEPHLHLDVVVNGVRVDPNDFMRTAEQLLALEEQDRLRAGTRGHGEGGGWGESETRGF